MQSFTSNRGCSIISAVLSCGRLCGALSDHHGIRRAHVGALCFLGMDRSVSYRHPACQWRSNGPGCQYRRDPYGRYYTPGSTCLLALGVDGRQKGQDLRNGGGRDVSVVGEFFLGSLFGYSFAFVVIVAGWIGFWVISDSALYKAQRLLEMMDPKFTGLALGIQSAVGFGITDHLTCCFRCCPPALQRGRQPYERHAVVAVFRSPRSWWTPCARHSSPAAHASSRAHGWREEMTETADIVPDILQGGVGSTLET